MENASSAFLDAVRKSMRQIRTAIGAKVVDPRSDLRGKVTVRGLSSSGRDERRHSLVAEQGIAIKEIVRRTDIAAG